VIPWGYLAYGICMSVVGVLADWNELTVGGLLFLPFLLYVIYSVIDLFWPLERPGHVRSVKRALYQAEKQRAGVRGAVRVQWLRLQLHVLLIRRKQQ
jgi:hypothetical protein